MATRKKVQAPAATGSATLGQRAATAPAPALPAPITAPPPLECSRCGCRHLLIIGKRTVNRRRLRIRECRHCGRQSRVYAAL
jgi:hypothetical protein